VRREEAERKRQELQRAVDDLVFEARPGRRLPLAVSVGAAIYPHDGETYESLLATADSRMYRDKTRRKQRARLTAPPVGFTATAVRDCPSSRR
jgi:GGDEF domain-containing protein